MPGAPYFIREEVGIRPGEVVLPSRSCRTGLLRLEAARRSGALCGPPPGTGAGTQADPSSGPLQLERARFEAGEALSALRRLQRRVSELEEESRLQDANVSGASLQSELAHSLEGDQDEDQDTSICGDTQVSSRSPSPPPVPSARGADYAPSTFPTRGIPRGTDWFLWPTDHPVPGDPRGIQTPAFTPRGELGAP